MLGLAGFCNKFSGHRLTVAVYHLINLYRTLCGYLFSMVFCSDSFQTVHSAGLTPALKVGIFCCLAKDLLQMKDCLQSVSFFVNFFADCCY